MGSLAFMTGGTPVSTGILYDNSWDDKVSPPGSNCATVGTQVLYDESVNTGNGNSWTPTIDPTLLPVWSEQLGLCWRDSGRSTFWQTDPVRRKGPNGVYFRDRVFGCPCVVFGHVGA